MYFFIAFFVVVLSASLITIRVLCAYSDYSIWLKWGVSLLVVSGWTAPLILGMIRRHHWLEGQSYAVVNDVLYALFGFVFLLFCVLLVRDFLWIGIHKIAQLCGKPSSFLDPMNGVLINRANIVAVVFCVMLTVWGLHEGYKTPPIKEVVLYSDKIKQPVDIVVLNDLHANRTTSEKRLKKLVAQIKGLRPEIVVMPGDVIDDRAGAMDKQAKLLEGIRGKYGTFLSLGNHEFYSGLNSWVPKFNELGFQLLYNTGQYIPELNIFVGGIPDYNSVKAAPSELKIDIYRLLKDRKEDSYKILLSHSPVFADRLYKNAVDLIVSGHTHGGQIYPFHHLVKLANHYVSGLYKVKGMDLYVSNGYGTWGPMMRLFAPSELTLIRLMPQENKQAK